MALEEPRWSCIPILYLKGISTGDFTECAERALLDAGRRLASQVPRPVARLTEVWAGEHASIWLKRDP